jgi:hypothetical protein
MGSGSSAQNDTTEIHENNPSKITVADVQVNYVMNGLKEPVQLTTSVSLGEGKICVTEVEDKDSSIDFELQSSVVKIHRDNGIVSVLIKNDDGELYIKSPSEEEAKVWLSMIREEKILSSNQQTDTEFDFHQFCSEYEEHNNESFHIDTAESTKINMGSSKKPKTIDITAPSMNIVILVVGTRGDVQPFVYLGQALKRDGHRVRLATHTEYRADVTTKGGLEYYPLDGDPRKLSEYMVKSGGRLLPDLLRKSEREVLPEKMKMLHDICFSCFPACTAPDPEDPLKKPFLADAIISNPVSYGHIHCAEALCIPLVFFFKLFNFKNNTKQYLL